MHSGPSYFAELTIGERRGHPLARWLLERQRRF
jgi:hypothetical protein